MSSLGSSQRLFEKSFHPKKKPIVSTTGRDAVILAKRFSQDIAPQNGNQTTERNVRSSIHSFGHSIVSQSKSLPATCVHCPLAEIQFAATLSSTISRLK
jgi:hypothetical protein